MVTSIVTTVYVENLRQSSQFYCSLLGLIQTFEADWVIQLSSPANESINLTLQPSKHELIPVAFRKRPQGVSIAFVVADGDDVFAKAKSMGLEIIQEPRNEEYGQRRFLTVDPDGLLVDVSSACEPSAEVMAQYFGKSDV